MPQTVALVVWVVLCRCLPATAGRRLRPFLWPRGETGLPAGPLRLF